MSANTLDPDILATMSDDERALLEGDEWNEDQRLAAESQPGDDDENDDDDAASAQASAAAPEAQAADLTVKADSAPADAHEASEASATEQVDDGHDSDSAAVESVRPVYKAILPDDYDAKVQDLTDRDTALADKFKSGEIDFDEFRAESAKINQERHDLSMAKVKAEISTEMGAQTVEQEWQATIAKFFARVSKDDDVDYRSDAKKHKDLDLFVKALAADEENADKPMTWFLSEAHNMVKAKHGLASKAPSAQDTSSAEKPTDKPRRPAPVDQAPPTLAHVPGSDGPGDVGDEFAELDRLDGLELEEAIAKMSPAQRDKYLKAA